MRGRTCPVLIFLLLLSAQSRADTACVDLAQLAHSTVGITRYFDEAERSAQSDVVGIHGTAWFQSPTNIVTVGHVATAMGLSTEDWKSLNIKDGADSQVNFCPHPALGWAAAREKLAVLELQTAFPAARSVAIRMSPLVPEDRLVTLAYPDQHPRIVAGRFVQYAIDGRLAGTALLEMYEGDNRFAIDHGASGAPCSIARAGLQRSSAP